MYMLSSIFARDGREIWLCCPNLSNSAVKKRVGKGFWTSTNT